MRRLATGLCAGYVVYFLSETVFWGRFNPETPQHEFILSWIVYSIMTMMLLTVIYRFRVRSFWALFLAGAVFGWICEGIYVQTMYDMFPIQISFTGLAWHSLISVCGGWYLLRHSLAHGTIRRIVGVSIGLGLFWGLWSVFWWIEHGERTSLDDYTFYALKSGALVVVALFIENKVQPKDFGSTRFEAWFFFAIAAAWYLFVTIAAAPLSLLVLPPLMALVFYALRKNRQQETRPDVLFELKAPVPWYRYLFVILMPVTAVVVYNIVWNYGHGLPTNWVVFLTTTPAGFILLAVSIYKILRNRIPPLAEPVPSP
jgi:hypothetical protein